MIEIKTNGLGFLINKLGRFATDLQTVYSAANNEIAELILNTEGLRKYPPETAANRPPEPYYIRGRGMQYKSRNDGRSEQYGSRWEKTELSYNSLKISNSASYAPYLTDDKKQAMRMAAIGWRKLKEVAHEKWKEAVKIYWKHITSLITRSGLK